MRKLVLNTQLDEEFKLIGISASLEDYKIVFLVNKHLNTRFKRTRKDVEMLYKDSPVSFTLFSYTDQKTGCKIYFVQNKSKYIDQNPKFVHSLFENEQQTISKYLITSHKQCDYLIKIEDDFDRFKIKKTINELNDIPQITRAYQINIEDVKTPQHLIFE